MLRSLSRKLPSSRSGRLGTVRPGQSHLSRSSPSQIPSQKWAFHTTSHQPSLLDRARLGQIPAPQTIFGFQSQIGNEGTAELLTGQLPGDLEREPRQDGLGDLMPRGSTPIDELSGEDILAMATSGAFGDEDEDEQGERNISVISGDQTGGTESGGGNDDNRAQAVRLLGQFEKGTYGYSLWGVYKAFHRSFPTFIAGDGSGLTTLIKGEQTFLATPIAEDAQAREDAALRWAQREAAAFESSPDEQTRWFGAKLSVNQRARLFSMWIAAGRHFPGFLKSDPQVGGQE